jgi:5'-nucleotidase
MPVASSLVCRVAEGLMQSAPPKGTVLNINVPAHCEGKVRWTTLGKRFYEDDVQERKDPRNRSYFWIGGGLAGIADIDGSDCQAVVREGIASITPLHQDLTQRGMLGEQAPKWQLGDFKLS